jgi:uncharacterized FlaG/YvyC family protein
LFIKGIFASAPFPLFLPTTNFNKGGTMDQTVPIPVKLASGTEIKFEVSQRAQTGRKNVAGIKDLSFKHVTEALQEIVKDLKETLDRVKPDKASVKFGVEMEVEAGNLTAMIVKGSGKGNLEITLEWGK